MNATETLLRGIVDYAGLFPPASLPLETVVQNYAQYRQHNRHGMLGRLILPAGKLDAFAQLVDRSECIDPDDCWSISALVPSVEDSGDRQALADAMKAIENFNSTRPALLSAVVDAIEVKLNSPQHVDIVGQCVGRKINAFLEVDWQQDPTPFLQAIASQDQDNLFAKIRTGGVTPDLIPPATNVARFILSSVAHEVGFKATAGLHHPLRGSYRLTYQDDAPLGLMHGFINMFVASALAFAGEVSDASSLIEILESTQAEDFRLGEGKIGFRDWLIDSDQVAGIRQGQATSFGSCSFDEPSQEISQLRPALKSEDTSA